MTEKIEKTATTSTSAPEAEPSELKSFTEPTDLLTVIRRNPFYTPISDILYWKDRTESALVFAMINCFFFLIIWAHYSLITLVSYLLLCFLIFCAGYVNIITLKASLSKQPLPENPLAARLKNRRFHLDAAMIDQHLEVFVVAVNIVLPKLKDVFLCTNLLLTAKFAIGFWFTAIIGKCISTAGLLYLGVILAFIWPKLYQEKQKEIDHFAGIAMEKIRGVTHTAMAKLPDSIKKKLE